MFCRKLTGVFQVQGLLSSSPCCSACSAILIVIFAVVETHLSLAIELVAPKRILVSASHLAAFLPRSDRNSFEFHVALWTQAVAGKSASEAGLVVLPYISGSVC